MGHLEETCGAVTGAFMVIGLKYGRTGDADDKNTKKKTYRLVKEFAEKIEARTDPLAARNGSGAISAHRKE